MGGNMKKSKLTALILTLCLVVGIAFPSITAKAYENTTTTTIQTCTIDYAFDSNSIVESKGVKGKIGKAALKAAAKTLRSSGLKSVLNGLKYVGFSTSTVNNITRYSYQVADVLDDLAGYSYVIKQTIYDKIAGALGGGTVAYDVAWWVATLIDWGLL